jgi:predicted DNA-binding transcriptional regulator AlpA
MKGRTEGALPRFARADKLAAMFGVNVSTIWRWAENGRLPRPQRIGPGVTCWDLDAVLAAIERNQAQERDASRA